MAKPKQRARKQQRKARRNPQMGTGSVNTRAELGIQVVDYFDYEYGAAGSATAGGVKHFYWETNQNLFDNNSLATSGQANTFCRVRRAEVYILPRIPKITATDPDFDSNASAMFTVNVQTPALAGNTRPIPLANAVAQATNVQVTNVLPRIDTTWKKVFSCDMQKTFQSGVIRPFYFQGAQCLFSMRCVEPVSGTDYQGTGNEAFRIRVKVVLHIDQPIAPIQRAKIQILSNNDVGAPDVNTLGNNPSFPFRDEYCQMDLKKVSHHMS